MDNSMLLPSLGPTIELASPEELYNVMLGASSQDPALLKQSSERLKLILQMQGGLDALQEIAAQRQVSIEVRKQSAIQLKNTIGSTWKSRRALTDEHRERIRNRTFEFIDEADDTIASCNEEVVAKLARMDFPARWPSVIPRLMQIIDTGLQTRYSDTTSEDPQITLRLRRSLRLLNAILKEMVSVKMPHIVATLGKIITEYKAVLYGYYSHISAFFSSPTTPSALCEHRFVNDVQLAHLVFKALFKLANWLWMRMERIGRELFEQNQAWFYDLVNSSILQVRNLIEVRHNSILALQQSGSTPDAAKPAIDILTRHVRLLGKFFRALQRFSSAKFVKIPACDELVLYYWSQVVRAADAPLEMTGESDQAVFPVKFLVQGMVMFKDSLSQWTPIKKTDKTLNPHALSRDFVEKAVGLLITRFMPLKPRDLESWMADPEEWVNMEDQDNDQWEFQLRPCSERVLMTLATQHQESVTPLLTSTFLRVFDPSTSQSAVDLPGVIEREALYCALGRCCHKLKGQIPFEEWLSRIFTQEAKSTNTLYPIIKRRVAWVIGKWVSETCTSPNNPVIWDILVGLLQSRGDGSDDVVRLTAAMAIKDCVNVIDFDFGASGFEPYLPATITELVKLMSESETWESKRRISDTLNVTIERSREKVAPFVGMIATPLPQLWTEAADNWLFKGSILTTMNTLVDAIGVDSLSLVDIVVPLIRDSLSPASITHLDEAALSLWSSALRNTPTIQRTNNSTACLLDLSALAVNLLATNLDLLGKIVGIVESYMIIDAAAVIQTCGVNLFLAFKSVLDEKKAPEINQKDLTKAIHFLLQIAPSASWGELMHVSGLFQTILATVRENEAGTLFLLEQIHILARIALADTPIFLQLMQGACAAAPRVTELQIWDGLLDHWVGKFDNMSEPQYRKLTAMSLASLAASGRVDILKRLSTEIYTLWIDVFYEIKEFSEDHPGSPVPSFKRNWETEEPPYDYFDGSEGTAEYERRKLIWQNDPVRTIRFSSFLDARLREAEASVGSPTFQAECIAKADPTVVEQITRELQRQ